MIFWKGVVVYFHRANFRIPTPFGLLRGTAKSKNLLDLKGIFDRCSQNGPLKSIGASASPTCLKIKTQREIFTVLIKKSGTQPGAINWTLSDSPGN